jgi:hypothetical protein
MQFRVVAGLLTGHDILRRHLYTMAMMDNPMYRRCGANERTSAHVLCECEALVMIRHTYLDSFFLDPKDVSSLSDTLLKGQHLHDFDFSLRGHKGLVRGLCESGTKGLEPINYSILFYSILFYSSTHQVIKITF